ncbi:hypothetical protein F4677DRAFT_44426 [Hypoxylon crocopeplum]|nr:hypothetical protein F4677DRAFT_44426 [Hypoxylon crocopeplum]
MDPLSGIGLVGSVLSFVEFGLKSVSVLGPIRQNSRQSSRNIATLEELAAHLTQLDAQLSSTFLSANTTNTTASERSTELAEIAHQCQQLSNQLLSMISEVHRPGKSLNVFNGPVTRRKFKDQEEEFRNRLVALQSELETALSKQIRGNLGAPDGEISRRLDITTRNIFQGLTDPRYVQRGQILSQVAAAERLIVRRETRLRLIDSPDHGPEFKPESQVLRAVQNAIMKWLSFSAMQQRLEDIQETHPGTFDWIFDARLRQDGYTSFPEWLRRNESGIYWVKGREGSGKSTLMKHIWRSPKTREQLIEWQGKSELCTAAFSLWRAGSSLARSQAGLLRSLLYTLLSQKPDLTPLAFPYQFSVLYRAEADDDVQNDQKLDTASVSELDVAFRRLVDSNTSSMKIFLLIDGLDECEGDIDQIVRLCQSFASSSNVKLVFSSREAGYHQFRTDFARSPSLTLEKLNKKDIEAFVQESLEQNIAFQELAHNEPTQAPFLVQEIALKSQGLFLWASLVVTSLLRSLDDGNTIDELRTKLTSTPKELAELYDNLVGTIPAQDREDASRLLQLLLEWNKIQARYTYDVKDFKAMPLLDLCFADGDIQRLLGSAELHMSDEDKMRSCQNMGRRLRIRCADFVKIQNKGSDSQDEYGTSSRIEFSHRTVLDYFSTSQQAKELWDITKEGGFNPPLSLLKSVVHRLKILDRKSRPSRKDTWDLALAALVYANHVETVSNNNSPDERYIGLLDELDRTMQNHHANQLKTGSEWTSKTYLLGNMTKNDKGWQARHQARVHWSNFHPSISQPLAWQNNMQSTAVQYGLRHYLTHSFKQTGGSVRKKKGRPLLDYALRPLEDLSYTLVTPEIVELLMGNGANLDEYFEQRTCWEHALFWQYRYSLGSKDKNSSTEDRRLNNIRLGIFRVLLIRYGADTKARVLVKTGELPLEKEVSLEDFFPICFGPCDEPGLVGLEDIQGFLKRARSSRRSLTSIRVK